MILDSLTAGDRAQLHELYARSVLLLELGRCKEWVELFEPHAILRCLPAPAAAEQRFEGREALGRLAARITAHEFDLAVGELHRPARLRHLLSNICLFEEGTGHVAGVAHVAVLSIGLGEPHWIASGTYTDRLTKCGSHCWRFQSRTFTPDAGAAVGWNGTIPVSATRATTSA